MTKEEVKALIKAKIEGQGSAIDAASVLPAILNGIMDLIDEGGGGTSDAVQYIPQTLSEAQQMQARKNQGLYYAEETPAGVITWDGNTEGKESVVFGPEQIAYKIADAPLDLPTDKVLRVLNASNEEFTFAGQTIPTTSGYLAGLECTLGSEFGGIFIANNPHIEGTITPYDGLVGIYVTENVRTIEYDAYGETIHQIPSEYLEDAVLYSPQTLTESEQMQARENLDLYYEKDNSGEKTIVGVQEDDTKPFPDEPMLDDIFIRVSDDTPEEQDILSIEISTQDAEQHRTSVQKPLSDFGKDTSYIPGITFYYYQNGASQAGFAIMWQDMSGGGVTYKKGLYLPYDINVWSNPFVSAITIYGRDVEINKVPPKYLPITKVISVSSTDEETPSAKSVYNYIINNPPSGTLRYDAAQSLNNTQKNQAIQNLGIENKIGSFITIDQDALENIWFANMSYDKMYNAIRSGGNIAATVSKNIEEIVDGNPEYLPFQLGVFSGEIIGERNAWPREDKIVFSNVIYGESSLEINTITFLPSSDSTPSGTFAKYTFNATKTTTP